MKKKHLVALSGIFLMLTFFLGSYFYKNHLGDLISGMGKGNAEPFVREYSPRMGDEEAKVTLVEFMDPACETCSAFHPYVKKLLNDNARKVKLVLRYVPFHRGADYCVKVLEAARYQGRFWETLELLLQTQSRWTHHHQVKPDQVWEILKTTDLDLEQLKADMEDPKILEIMKQDLEDANTLSVKRTPGFFVNGKPLEKFGYRHLRDLILSEIKDQY